MKISKQTYFACARVGLAIIVATIVCQFKFEYIEAIFFDARVRLSPTAPVSGDIQTIAVDASTVEKLGRVPDARDHLELIKNLRNAGARALIYLINPSEIVGSFNQQEQVASAMKNFSNFYVGLPEMALKGEEDAYRLLPPFENLNAVSAPKAVDRTIFAGDEVVRRMITSYQGRQTLYPLVASLYNPSVGSEKNIRGVFDYLQSDQLYIKFHPQRTYVSTSFQSLLAPDADLSKFNGKIVIIGRDIQTTIKDYARTPFSRDVIAMTNLELSANMIDTLIMNSGPIRSPLWLDFLVTLAITILTLQAVLLMTPTRGLSVLISTISVYFLIAWVFYWLGDYWIGMAQPFIAIFVSYYFFIPYRLIIENRRSWEYLQKNRLLTQVEELKTNFLSMMSHDLKTPIARIQGMTEVVLKDTNPLSLRQTEALETLGRSSQELLEFVSSILNLGRIESKEIELHLKSRDPNGLLHECIEKLDHLAKNKTIQIVAEFEPLFSARMDVDLIRQVFSNLIENAIKYSPENSRILLSTEEVDGHVIIQVADQGMGIPEDELPHVFDKFYRSKSAKSSPTKGSGLGLYLAKYFIELHNGTISVDSRLGGGSTFTVNLPTGSVSKTTSKAVTSKREDAARPV